MSPWITSNASTRQLMSSSCNAGVAAALAVICRQHDLLDWRIWQSGAGWAAVHHAARCQLYVQLLHRAHSRQIALVLAASKGRKD